MNSPVPASVPHPPPTFDAQLFRQKLAGLTDPDYSAGDDNSAAAEHKRAAIDLCVCLCELFGESLDRTTLWDRIGSALMGACPKCADGDTDRFVSLCMEHVRADVGRASRHEILPKLLADWSERPAVWRQGFVRYVATHLFSIVPHARLAWERVKERRAASNGGGR